MWKRFFIISLIVVLVLWSPWVHLTRVDVKINGAVTPSVDCCPLLGWFTREDRLCIGTNGLENMKLRQGDILVTVSTHSLGWRHGHAALVIDENTVLEAAVMGKDAILCSVDGWFNYADVAVLRVNCNSECSVGNDGRRFGPGMDIGEQVARYAVEELRGRPYRLTAGLLGEKAPAADTRMFGVQCAYLAWYAWQHHGYDLDADGGRLVTCSDLLESELVEVVYSYGIHRTVTTHDGQSR